MRWSLDNAVRNYGRGTAEKLTEPADNSRVHEIDGIRGWAALVVLEYHLCCEIFRTFLSPSVDKVTSFVLDGQLAVFIFFVLSGDALSFPFLSRLKTSYLDRQILKRYFRLAIPILMSCLLVYVLIKCKLVFAADAGKIVDSEDWLGTFAAFKATLPGLLNYSLFDVFASIRPSGPNYNAFLWTMPIELVSSYIIFAFLYALPRINARYGVLIFAALLAAFINEYLCLFFAGILFAQLRVDGVWYQLGRSRFRFLIPIIGFAGCVGLDIGFQWLDHRIGGTGLPKGMRCDILAVAVVFAIYSSPVFRGFFSNALSRFLGFISFPLYIVQFPVIVSLTSWLIVVKFDDSQSEAWMWAIIALSTSVTVGLAFGFRLVEDRLLGTLDRLVRKFIGPRVDNPQSREHAEVGQANRGA